MKAVLMQRVSENARRVESNYFVWILCVASIVLFILTVDSLTITDLEPYGLYYLRILPATYWAGVGAAVAAIMISMLYDTRRRNDIRIIPVLVLGLFLFGTPVFTYEVPRFTDIFAHGAEALPVISNGEIDSDDRYAREYPSPFVLLGISAILQDIAPLALIRFAELFTILVVITLVYCIARTTNSRFSALAPISFMGAFWVDQGHFSPQGLALVFYMVFFLAIIKAISASESRRGWLATAFVMLLAINLTSPTNSLFLVLNLATVGIVAFAVFRRKNLVSNRVIVFTALAGAIFLSWSIYNAESRTVLRAEEFERTLADNFGTENVQLTPSPSTSYQLVLSLRLLVVGFVLLSGMAVSILLIRRKQKSHYVIILVGWFATASFIAISMYLSPVLLSRNFMYVSIPWALLMTVFFAQNLPVKRDKVAKAVVLSIVVILLVSIPATRYGRDPTTYASSSLVSSADTLAAASKGGERVISYSIGSLVTKYYAAVHGVDVDTITFDRVFQKSYFDGDMDAMVGWLHSQSIVGRVIFSDPEKNNIAMKFDEPELYDRLEESVEEDHNLIINSGSTRVYSSTSGVALTEE